MKPKITDAVLLQIPKQMKMKICKSRGAFGSGGARITRVNRCNMTVEYGTLYSVERSFNISFSFFSVIDWLTRMDSSTSDLQALLDVSEFYTLKKKSHYISIRRSVIFFAVNLVMYFAAR